MDIERDNELFTNDPGPSSRSRSSTRSSAPTGAGIGLRTLIHTDDPHHRDLRKVGADCSSRRRCGRCRRDATNCPRSGWARWPRLGPELDFAQDIAVNYPLYLILTLLGMPESDFGFMLKLTQELFGANDEEMAREGSADARAFMARSWNVRVLHQADRVPRGAPDR